MKNTQLLLTFCLQNATCATPKRNKLILKFLLTKVNRFWIAATPISKNGLKKKMQLILKKKLSILSVFVKLY